MKTLIIGIGNTLRRDDGFGIHVTERLEQILPPDRTERVEIMAVHQLTPDLAEPISRAAKVIFIDAAATGEPGTVQCETVDASDKGIGASVHHVEPGSLLSLARMLYGQCPPATMLSVPGEDFAVGEGLSEKVAAVLEQVVQMVRQMLV